MTVSEYRVSKGRRSGYDGLRTLVRAFGFTDRPLNGQQSLMGLPWYLVLEALEALFPAQQKKYCRLTELSSLALLSKPSLLPTLVGNSLLSLFLRDGTRDPDASFTRGQASVTSLCRRCLCFYCFPSEKPGLTDGEEGILSELPF